MLVFFRIRRGGRVQTANMPPSRSDPAIRQVATDLTRENEQLVEGAERMRAQVKEWEELALGWRREAKRRRLYDEAAVKEVNHWYVEYYKLKHGEEPNPPYPPARGVGKAGEAERDRDPNSRDREDGREAERDREEAERVREDEREAERDDRFDDRWWQEFDGRRLHCTMRRPRP